jgi:hypothetical protein
MKPLTKRLITILLLFTVLLAFTAVAAFASSDSTVRYGKSTLAGKERYVYEKLEEVIAKSEPGDTVVLEKSEMITESILAKAYAVFMSDYPECFYVEGSYRYSYYQDGTVVEVYPVYTHTGSSLTAAKSELDSAVSEILSRMPKGSDYDKALYLHDALAEWVDYRETGYHQTSYGALVDKKAVCAGYAKAYQLLLQKAGIDAWTVTGTSYKPSTNTRVGHAWNVMWLDGKCVYADVTWDDQGDEIYRYYFAMSKEEIGSDHITDTSVFTLPACNHTKESYFDRNKLDLTSGTLPSEAAKCFDSTEGGIRTAAFYYIGTDATAWVDANIEALYEALGGAVGTYTYSVSSLGKEVHITLKGNFAKEKYRVTITPCENLTENAIFEETIDIGSPMTTIIYETAAKYYFPEDYYVPSVNGISVTRNSYYSITVSGTPTEDVRIVLPEVKKKTEMPMPSAVFTATGDYKGTLSGLQSGWQYSIDGVNWIDCTEESVELEALSGKSGLYVRNPKNSELTADSVQYIAFRWQEGGGGSQGSFNPGFQSGGSDTTEESAAVDFFKIFIYACIAVGVIAVVLTVVSFIRRR